MSSSGWATVRVRDLEADGVLLVQDGNHGERRPRAHEIVPEGVAHIRAADIDDNGSIDFAGAQKLNEDAVARITKGIGARGDVLLTHKGTVGRVARRPRRCSFVHLFSADHLLAIARTGRCGSGLPPRVPPLPAISRTARRANARQ